LTGTQNGDVYVWRAAAVAEVIHAHDVCHDFLELLYVVDNDYYRQLYTQYGVMIQVLSQEVRTGSLNYGLFHMMHGHIETYTELGIEV